jgi:hypothetical protein
MVLLFAACGRSCDPFANNQPTQQSQAGCGSGGSGWGSGTGSGNPPPPSSSGTNPSGGGGSSWGNGPGFTPPNENDAGIFQPTDDEDCALCAWVGPPCDTSHCNCVLMGWQCYPEDGGAPDGDAPDGGLVDAAAHD